MKRFLSTILVLTLILGCAAVGRADTPGDVLEVCNCNEYVTLRRAPDTASEGITRVGKGERVYFEDFAANDFYQVSYGADTGYILSMYLKNAESESGDATEDFADNPAGFDELPGLPPYADFIAIGDPVCEAVCGEYHLAARRAVVPGEEKEELLAVCYDSAGNPLWTAFEVSNVVTELDTTDAFIAGTAESPCLVTFLSGKGFTARAIDDRGTLLWICNCANRGTALETVLPGGSLTTAVTEDGTIYAVGYYNEAPVAIDVNGNFLWKGENPDPVNVFWPCEILPSAAGITVLYDSCFNEDDMVYSVTYDTDNGACTGFTAVERPMR